MDGNNTTFCSTFSSCSKKSGLSPEDTALIKGTNRGTFIGSADDLATNAEEFSPIGATISGIDGSDGLAPQDPFWSDPDALETAEPFDPIFLVLISTTSVRMKGKNYRTSRFS